MLITRVELEDIKNYETGSFSFGPGVTAIGGPNGAGKTTILEAIAWALFDHLPYKKEDFLRRGAKRGSVRVTFESALDGREYTVYRDTGSGYYIYDPITKLRLVEQKNQVGIWIKQHLGVEPTADLKTLFTSTIGVPQGTFTVDFSDQPAKRKVSFDKVLRVDEYQRSSEELRSLIRLVESRDGELREEIARVEVEVAALDGLMTERSRYQALAEGLKQELSNAERNLDKARKELERLDRLQRSIERTTIDYAALSSKIEDIERRRASVAYEVERARRANEAVIRATAGFTNYTEAQMCLSQLEPRAVHRDAIKEEHSVKERELIRTESTAHHQREKIRQLEADRVEMERLRPLAEEQEALESRRAELQTSLGQLTVLEERSAIAERELKALRADYADLLKQSEEIEKLKELAERAPVLEQERRLAESELRDLQVALERLGERKKEMKRVRDNIAKLEGEIKTLEKEMAAGLEAEQVVANLSQLEGEDQAAMEEIAQLKASIERDKQILSKIQGGLCPLLSERCLNMKEGQGLDQYFKIQMGSEREQLAVVEGKRKAIQRKLIDAKAALKIASALASQRVQHSRYLESLEIERDTHQRLGAEIKSTQVNEKAVRQASDRLEQLEKDRQQAQAARSRYESLDLIKERLERLKAEGTEKRSALEELKRRVAALSGLGDELAQIDGKLANLDDPRGRIRMLNLGLQKESELREALAALEEKEQELRAAVQDLSRGLEAFAGLDQQISFERERRAASEKDYLLYIENQPVAAMLEAREGEFAAIDSELSENRKRLETLGQELEQLRSDYDEERHAQVKREVEELINQVASLASEVNVASGRLAELSEEIDRLIASKKRLFELLEQRDRCSQLHSLSDFIRDVLKKAAPFITEAHLQSISMEANQLYREITGNPMVSLRWDPGYEVVLEEGGHERAFASLSGGEQMAAALAVRLALLKELSDMRIAFFDEPTTNMDEERRRNLAQQIGRIKDFDQLFVISHDDAFEGFTDRVISVRSSAEGAR